MSRIARTRMIRRSLFRFSSWIELLIVYLVCFSFNTLLCFALTLDPDSFTLASFLDHFAHHRVAIVSVLTSIVLIFHYQMLMRARKEIYCRFLVGDTVSRMRIRYMCDCGAALVIAFLITVAMMAALRLPVVESTYLLVIFGAYIGLSLMLIKR